MNQKRNHWENYLIKVSPIPFVNVTVNVKGMVVCMFVLLYIHYKIKSDMFDSDDINFVQKVANVERILNVKYVYSKVISV